MKRVLIFALGLVLIGSILFFVATESRGSVNYSPNDDKNTTNKGNYTLDYLKNTNNISDNNTIQNLAASKTFFLEGCNTINQSGTYYLQRDIFAGPSCFLINASNVVLNGMGHNVIGNKGFDEVGISITNIKDVVITNIGVVNYYRGIFVYNSSKIKIIKNKIISNIYGIEFNNNSFNNEVTNNDISSGTYALLFHASTDNLIAYNTISENYFTIITKSNKNTFYSNLLSRNIKPISSFFRNIKETTIEKPAGFNITMISIDQSFCKDCKIFLEINPQEKSLSYDQNGPFISGSFIPSEMGIYSIRIEIVDPYNNTEVMKYVYLVNATLKDTAYYYLRGKDPTHGQALSWGGFKADSGSLLLSRPSISETRKCFDWVQFSPDQLPEHLLGIIKEINFSMYYNMDNPGSMGVQRFSSYDNNMDKRKDIALTSQPVSESASFNIEWPINYFWEWYWLTLKIESPQGFPTFYTDSDRLSSASITYLYSDTPGIRFISNKDITFLSATMTDRDSDAAIVLDGNGITSIQIEMPDKEKRYLGIYNGISCDINEDCLMNYQSNGDMEFLLFVKGKNTLIIKQTNSSLSLR